MILVRNTNQFAFHDAAPDTQYEIALAAKTGGGYGKDVKRSVTTWPYRGICDIQSVKMTS